jgi:hypothetical protein
MIQLLSEFDLVKQLQNRVSLTIELSKLFTFGYPVVLLDGFGDVADTWWWGPQYQGFFPFSLILPFRCVLTGLTGNLVAAGNAASNRLLFRLRSPRGT